MSSRDDLVRALGPETVGLIEELISERLEQHRSSRELYSVAEYAAKLGVSQRSVRARIERKQLPIVRVGHSLFIRPE